jgi:hypothetical protein
MVVVRSATLDMFSDSVSLDARRLNDRAELDHGTSSVRIQVMSTTTPTTAEQLAEMPSDQRCELVAGEMRMMSPSSWRHGEVVGKVYGGQLVPGIRCAGRAIFERRTQA